MDDLRSRSDLLLTAYTSYRNPYDDSANIKLTGFEDKFLTQISSGARGSFYGSEDARRGLLEIIRHR